MKKQKHETDGEQNPSHETIHTVYVAAVGRRSPGRNPLDLQVRRNRETESNSEHHSE